MTPPSPAAMIGGPLPAPSEAPAIRRAALAVCLAAFALGCLACGGGPVPRQTARSAAKERPRLTAAKYEGAMEGLSYAQVVGIVGFRGEEVSRAQTGDITTVVYAWKGDFGASMTATFQNDRLVSKSQSGLK